MNVEQDSAVPVSAEGRPPPETDRSCGAEVSRYALSLCEIVAGECVRSYVAADQHNRIAKVEKRVSAAFGDGQVNGSSHQRQTVPKPDEVVRIERLIPETLQHLADRMLRRLGEIPDECYIGNVEPACPLAGRLARRTEFRSAGCFWIVWEDTPDNGFRQRLS